MTRKRGLIGAALLCTATLTAGCKLSQVRTHDFGPAMDAAVSPDGARLVVVQGPEGVRMLNARDGTVQWTWSAPGERPVAAAITGDGQRVVVASSEFENFLSTGNSAIRFLDAAKGREAQYVRLMGTVCRTECLAPGGQYLVVDGSQCHRVLKADSGADVAWFPASARAWTFSYSGKHVAWQLEDGSVHVQCLEQDERPKELPLNNVKLLALTDNGLIVQDDAGLWHVGLDDPAKRTKLPLAGDIVAVEAVPHTENYVAVSGAGHVCVGDNDGQGSVQIGRAGRGGGSLRAFLSASSDGKVVAVGAYQTNPNAWTRGYLKTFALEE